MILDPAISNDPHEGRSSAVLMPVYNEAATVIDVLDAVREHYPGEIIVVDDGSTDRTSSILAERGDITMISHPRNMGYGRALAEGFALARSRGKEFVITMDCDGQHEPAHIPQFLEAIAEGGDVISGSRYLPESKAISDAPAHRREVNARITKEINSVTGWGITDAFCGFKAYCMASLKSITLKEPGYGMPLELWAKAHTLGLDIREIPVERIYHDADRSFGPELDDPERRFRYYMNVWNSALEEAIDG